MRSSLLYYVPGAANIDQAKAAIPHALEGARVSCVEVSRGPDGNTGFVLVPWGYDEDRAPIREGYYPDEQDWRSLDGVPYWVGWQKGYKPDHLDLMRPGGWSRAKWGLTTGYGDWGLPCARFANGKTSLPETLRLEHGKIVRQVADDYADLSAAAVELHDALAANGDFELEEDRAIDIIVMALASIYRVAKLEVLALGILRTDLINTMIGYIADVPSVLHEAEVRAAQKKSTSQSDTPPAI